MDRARRSASWSTDYEGALPPGGWPNWVLGNHDQPRIAARVGAAQARVAAMLLLTLRGTPTMYYGDEIGIGPSADRAARRCKTRGKKTSRVSASVAIPRARRSSGTPRRTQDSRAGEPWLPVDPSCESHNVKVLRADPASILSLYRDADRVRRKHPALHSGTFRLLAVEGDVLALRAQGGRRTDLVALNLGHATRRCRCAESLAGAELLASTHLDRVRFAVRR